MSSLTLKHRQEAMAALRSTELLGPLRRPITDQDRKAVAIRREIEQRRELRELCK